MKHLLVKFFAMSSVLAAHPLSADTITFSQPDFAFPGPFTEGVFTYDNTAAGTVHI